MLPVLVKGHSVVSQPSQPSKLPLVRVQDLLALFVIMILTLGAQDPIQAQNRGSDRGANKVDWRVGRDFRNQLQSEIGFTWQDKPLRDGLRDLATSQKVAIFLDRRVSPNQEVTISVDSKPLIDALRELASELKLGVGTVGPVIYFGPPLTCARISTLAAVRKEQVRELPEATHKRILKQSELEWPELSEPRLIVARAATSVGLTIPNISAIPHDLWVANDLPKMSFPEQATLLLAGFDTSFRFGTSGRKIWLARFPRSVSIERRYKASDVKKKAEEYQKEFPQAFVEIDEESNEIVVRSLLEDHQKIALKDRGRTVAERNPATEKRHTLNVKNQPVGRLIEFLAKTKFGMDFEVAPEISEEELKQRVSISVKEVTTEELLQKLAQRAGLQMSFDGNRARLSKLPEK